MEHNELNELTSCLLKDVGNNRVHVYLENGSRRTGMVDWVSQATNRLYLKHNHSTYKTHGVHLGNVVRVVATRATGKGKGKRYHTYYDRTSKLLTFDEGRLVITGMLEHILGRAS